MEIILTRKEVEFSRNHWGKMVLFVVHSIKVDNGKLSGGKNVIAQPWKLEKDELSPIAYTCKIPSKTAKKKRR